MQRSPEQDESVSRELGAHLELGGPLLSLRVPDFSTRYVFNLPSTQQNLERDFRANIETIRRRSQRLYIVPVESSETVCSIRDSFTKQHTRCKPIDALENPKTE